MSMTDERTYNSVDEIREANAAAGQYWFSPATMRFFNSRVGRTVYGGRYFISSEQRESYTPRLYTIRVANADGSIDTVGEFQQYETLKAAKRAAQLRAWRESVQ